MQGLHEPPASLKDALHIRRHSDRHGDRGQREDRSTATPAPPQPTRGMRRLMPCALTLFLHTEPPLGHGLTSTSRSSTLTASRTCRTAGVDGSAGHGSSTKIAAAACSPTHFMSRVLQTAEQCQPITELHLRCLLPGHCRRLSSPCWQV